MNNNTHSTEKSLWKKIATFVGAIAGLLAAATPGVVEYLDKSEDRAHEQAQKSEEMAELAWEKVRLELIYLREQVSELKENDKAKNKLLAEMLLERARAVPTTVHSHRFRQVREEEVKDDSLEGITLKAPHVAAEALLDEAAELDESPAHLPTDLEEEWVKGKK